MCAPHIRPERVMGRSFFNGREVRDVKKWGGRMGGGVGWGEGSPRSPGGGRVRGMEGIGFLLLNYLSTEVTTILRKKIS